MIAFLRAPVFCAVFLGAVVALLPSSADASHYRLAGTGLVSPEELRAFASAKVTSTKDLLDAGLDRGGRVKLVRQTGLKKSRIEELVRICDLLRIEGVGPSVARLMREAGFRDVRGLRKASAESLWRGLVEGNRKLRLMPEVPSQKLVSSWLARSRSLPVVLRGLK